jgi:hypothetical protein
VTIQTEIRTGQVGKDQGVCGIMSNSPDTGMLFMAVGAVADRITAQTEYTLPVPGRKIFPGWRLRRAL